MKHFKLYEEYNKENQTNTKDNSPKPNTNQPTKNTEPDSGVMSSMDMLNMEFEQIDFTGDWLTLFGKPSPTCSMLFHGGAGSGKTTFLLKMAKYLSVKFGKVLYVSSEEYNTSTLLDKIEKYEAFNDNLFYAKDLERTLDDYDFIVIDSVNDLKLTLTEFKQLKKEYPLTAFLLVFQQTKDGDYRGTNDWEHEVDLAAKVEEGVIEVYKNRFGDSGNSLNVFDNISNIESENVKKPEEKKD